MTNKINIEDIKLYKRAINAGQSICYVCGTIDPECGMVPMVGVNLDPEAITDTICRKCYDKVWKEAIKSESKIEDVWGLGK
jgi:hypothetical protein